MTNAELLNTMKSYAQAAEHHALNGDFINAEPGIRSVVTLLHQFLQKNEVFDHAKLLKLYPELAEIDSIISNVRNLALGYGLPSPGSIFAAPHKKGYTPRVTN